MLKPPESWHDELSRGLEPEAFAPAAQGALRLALTYRASLPDRLAELGITLDEVLTDMAGGFIGDWRGRTGDYYCLSGTRFDVFLSQQDERDSGAPLAVVTSVKPAQRLAHRDGTATAQVSFHPPYKGQRCDIADVHRVVEDALDRARLRREARKRAGRALAGKGTNEHGLAALHADVRRRYSALRLMLSLLRQRGEVEGGAKAAGEVIDATELGPAAAGLLCVRVASQEGDFEDGATVDLTVADRRRPWRLELVRAEDELFCLEPPSSGDVQPGAAVSLSYEPRFALNRHDRALNQFLNERVEGDWASLARLLSAPDTLPAQRPPPPLSPYNADLNPEQRTAVAGALAAPHAFFIQGPPGTGKTTVITELVRQLVARGERVLLLAQMHVAVDEVLRRVGDADGVLALRISWDDSKVREDLRRFTPDNVASEFVRRARRPATSKAAQWREQASRLVAEQDLIQRCIAARQVLADAQDRHERAVGARESWQSAHDAARTGLDAELAERRDLLDEAQAGLDAARQGEQAVADALSEARANRTFGDRLAGLVGLGNVARRQRAHRDAEREMTAAEANRAPLVEHVGEATANRDAFVRQGALEAREHVRRCAEAAREADEARRAVAARAAELGPVLADTDPTTLTDSVLVRHAERRRTRAHRLEQYIRLERRWFEIAGLTSTASDAEQRRLIADLGGDLLQAANLVCCTTAGFGGAPLVCDSDYDTLIVDEASRVVDSEFLIGAKQARRWILVGDEHQLPPYVDSTDEHHLHALTALHMTDRGAAPDLQAAVEHLGRLWREDEELHRFRTDAVQRAAERLRDSGLWRTTFQPEFSAAYQRLRQLGDDAERELLGAMRHHLVRSLFERCVEACPQTLRQPLIEQRRMIDTIAKLVRDPIYGGGYSSASEEELRRCGVSPLVGETLTRPVVFLDTSEQPRAGEELRGTGFVNPLEAEWIAAACKLWERELSRRGEERITVSVLAFYRAQAREIRRALGHPGYRGFRTLSFQVVDSIDRIQGQESDLVLLSFCRTRRGRQGAGFGLWLQDVRRLNVACTRARRGLVLVGHRRTLERLSGIPAAQEFYRNLFDVFDSSAEALTLKDLR